MKKTLLSLSILASSACFAQQLDATNEPIIGDMLGMFVLDSLASNYTATTGSGVTWDYSATFGYPGSTKIISIGDPSLDVNGGDFPGTTKTFGIPGFLTSFMTSDATQRLSHGYVFNEPNLGDVIAKYDVNQQTIVTYPFALSSSVTDNYSGEVIVPGLGTFPATGVGTATIDGQGTLKLGQGTDYLNVIRYKIVETTTATVPLLGTVDLIREQYEYYHFAVSNLPVFIHVKATITGAVASEIQLVMSSVEPDEFLGVSEIENSKFNIYPNPANNKFTVKGENLENATINVYDQTGKLTASFTQISNGQELELINVNAGVYIVKIENGNTIATKKLIIE